LNFFEEYKTPTILAGLILIITKSTVERRKLTKLIALEFVLSLGNRGSLLTISTYVEQYELRSYVYRFDNIVNQFLGFIDFVLGVCHDKTMEIFFLIAGVSGVRTTFALLDRAFATNGNLGTRFSLHLF